ncbi:hypothetical protein RIF29_25941 [Crotalaria pallida]|uniref:Uncharacterized protein n=1 Tax=Crotalaria pallida TaxID=3830 RepID=A0AAN9EN28_CROPI
MFQNIFPTIEVKLLSLLLPKDCASRRIIRLVQNRQVPDLKNLRDVSDFVTKFVRAGYGSESEGDEEAATVTLSSDIGLVNRASTKSAVWVTKASSSRNVINMNAFELGSFFFIDVAGSMLFSVAIQNCFFLSLSLSSLFFPISLCSISFSLAASLFLFLSPPQLSYRSPSQHHLPLPLPAMVPKPPSPQSPSHSISLLLHYRQP